MLVSCVCQTSRVAAGPGGGVGRGRVGGGRAPAAARLRAVHLPALPRAPRGPGQVPPAAAGRAHLLQVL